MVQEAKISREEIQAATEEFNNSGKKIERLPPTKAAPTYIGLKDGRAFKSKTEYLPKLQGE